MSIVGSQLVGIGIRDLSHSRILGFWLTSHRKDCTAIGNLDPSLNQDCDRIQSY